MHLDRKGGQAKGAERQQSPGDRIGSHAFPVLDEPGRESLLKGVLVVIEEYAKEELVRCQGPAASSFRAASARSSASGLHRVTVGQSRGRCPRAWVR